MNEPLIYKKQLYTVIYDISHISDIIILKSDISDLRINISELKIFSLHVGTFCVFPCEGVPSFVECAVAVISY